LRRAPRFSATRLTEHEFLAAVEQPLTDAIQRGEIVLINTEAAGGGAASGLALAPAAAIPKERRVPQKTFVEFQLLDQDNEPVSNERYRLKITDGSVREGRLDSEGCVRVSNIEPGDCRICFPDLDGDNWRPIG
jgi:hypothetical protein